MEDCQIIELYWQKQYPKPPTSTELTASPSPKIYCTAWKIPRSASTIHGFTPGTRFRPSAPRCFGCFWRKSRAISPLTVFAHEIQKSGAAVRSPWFWTSWWSASPAGRMRQWNTSPKNWRSAFNVSCGRCRSRRETYSCADIFSISQPL